MGGWRPKGYADTADHPGGCPGQNILEIKNSGRKPHLVGKGEEKEVFYKNTNNQQYMKFGDH